MNPETRTRAALENKLKQQQAVAAYNKQIIEALRRKVKILEEVSKVDEERIKSLETELQNWRIRWLKN